MPANGGFYGTAMLRKKRCRDYGEWLSALVDQEVPRRREQSLRAHLAECHPCARLYRQLVQTKHVVRHRLSQRVPSESLLERLQQALDAVDRERQAGGLRPRRAGDWRLAAALAVLLLGIAGTVWRIARPDFVVERGRLAQVHRMYQERTRPPAPELGLGPRQDAAVLTRSLGYPVSILPLPSGMPFRYVGAEVCRCLNRKGCALFLYRDPHDHLLSRFHLQGRKGRFIGLEPCTFQGHPAWRGKEGDLNLLVWQEGSDYQIWVSEVPLEKLLPFFHGPWGNGN